MGLFAERTKWVLFLGSVTNNAEARHWFDLMFGLRCLENAGINQEDIWIYVDCGDSENFSRLLQFASPHKYILRPTSHFFNDQRQNGHENLVLFVTGHGSIEGIDASTVITPHALLTSLKTSPQLRVGIVYFGQCYAGIFDYVRVGRRGGRRNDDPPGSQTEPEIIFLGATKLYESLSAETTEQFLGGSIPWIANLFLLNVFKWIERPIDVDGDGRFTIIDSYKYAGIRSNALNKQIKSSNLFELLKTHDQFKKLTEAHTPQISPSDSLKLQALSSKYDQLLDIHNVHQECWILNANPAQRIEF